MKKKSVNLWLWLGIAGMAVFLIWLAATNFLLNNQGITIASGTFGDSFGWLNSLFSGLALAAIVVSLIIQR